jgi:fumarate reductase subunit D
MSSFSAHRNQATYWAFVLHRLSGLALALFLPVHLYVLSLAIGDGAALDGFLDWTANPWVKAAEVGLVVLLALHMAGGLRILALEFLPWRDNQKTLAAIASATALAFGVLYLLNVI